MTMQREIMVRRGAQTEVAVWEDGRLVEYLVEEDREDAAETILLGRVERVAAGMKAAFVNIGQEKNGFLPLEEKSQSVVLPPLQCGDRVLVQVRKEAQGMKGAFLTRDVTLCGQTVILMPMNRYVGISARIKSEAERTRLKQLGEDITAGEMGLVLRSAAAEASEETIREEAAQLAERWQTLLKAAPTAHAPSVLYRPRTLPETVLDDYLPRGVAQLWVSEASLLPGTVDCPITVEDSEARWTEARRQADKALERFVWLPSGGSLVIDACEAMTVIDVNTGKYIGKKQLEETLLKIDLEACAEIARQARLRNMGGVIVIDFIDLKEEAHLHAVQEALAEAFREDRVKTVIHGFTALNLMEMTRKRSRPPLREMLTKPCPRCHGSGRIKDNTEDAHA